MRFILFIIFILLVCLVNLVSSVCKAEDYCPGGWLVLRKADDTPQTCDAMGGIKCQKPYSCVHSRCGMDFCCAHTYKIEQWKRQQEIEADIKEAELEDDDEL
ncbi:unnamed protein product [Caenorhabditis nigoni]|uniref:WAP domain-containing protein n=1 Tax=Caenorhabditis nigoni TaxID=1611254 RepID=A0A2G5T236_9PELO|nr:hypothetical protein B9Z55_026166 [Caenorhabditis nigoni]